MLRCLACARRMNSVCPALCRVFYYPIHMYWTRRDEVLNVFTCVRDVYQCPSSSLSPTLTHMVAPARIYRQTDRRTQERLCARRRNPRVSRISSAHAVARFRRLTALVVMFRKNTSVPVQQSILSTFAPKLDYLIQWLSLREPARRHKIRCELST